MCGRESSRSLKRPLILCPPHAPPRAPQPQHQPLRLRRPPVSSLSSSFPLGASPDLLAWCGSRGGSGRYAVLRLALHAFLAAGMAPEALDVLAGVLRGGKTPSLPALAALLCLLFRAGEVRAAWKVFEEMAVRGPRPSLATFNAMILGSLASAAGGSSASGPGCSRSCGGWALSRRSTRIKKAISTAVAAITVPRHFKSQLDPYTMGALAEIASGRTFFVDNYDRKTKETKVGMMQVTAEVAQWLGRELGYKNYDIELEDNINLLYWPFVNVYYGAACAEWLFSCDEKKRTEEFVVRAYKGGKTKATHKSTSRIFQRYLYVKETLLSMRCCSIHHHLQLSCLSRRGKKERPRDSA